MVTGVRGMGIAGLELSEHRDLRSASECGDASGDGMSIGVRPLCELRGIKICSTRTGLKYSALFSIGVVNLPSPQNAPTDS